MTLSDLIALFRSEADDTVAPFLWSDADALDYANDAQDEACRRARLLVDSSTNGICNLAVTVLGAGLLTLDPRILFVRRARFSGALPLRRMNMQDMESMNPYWQNTVAGMPKVFIPDYETGKLLIWPPPDAAATLLLTVVRMPLVSMAANGDAPEIAARWHRSLRHWMLYRAYSKQDSQSNDPKKASDAMTLFEQEFGKKSSAIDENWIEHEQTQEDGTY